jgi:hypothetical protein
MFIVHKKYADVFSKLFFTFDKQYDLEKFRKCIEEISNERFKWHINSVHLNLFSRQYESHYHRDIEHHTKIGMPEIETKRSIGKVDIYQNGFSIYINHAFGDMSLVYRFVYEVLRLYCDGIISESTEYTYTVDTKIEKVPMSTLFYQHLFGIDKVTSLSIQRVNSSISIQDILRAVHKQCKVHIDFIRQSKNERTDGSMTPQVTGTLINFNVLIKHDFDIQNIPDDKSVSLDELTRQLIKGRRKTLLLFSDLRKQKCMDHSNELHFVRCSGINYYIRNLVYDIIVINLVQYEKEYVDVIFNYAFKNNTTHKTFQRNITNLFL